MCNARQVIGSSPIVGSIFNNPVGQFGNFTWQSMQR